jgi:hypothetical protein
MNTVSSEERRVSVMRGLRVPIRTFRSGSELSVNNAGNTMEVISF